jgi:rhodanese-related sulfurtransferase
MRLNPVFLFTLVAIGIIFYLAMKGVRKVVKYYNLESDAFADMLKENNVILLDVRTEDEFNAGHIENAQLIDVKKSDFSDRIKSLDPEKTYLVYCRSGVRSVKAAVILSDNGFSKVYNLLGGYNAWTEKNR